MTNNCFLTKELVFTKTSIINFEKNNLDVVMDICEDSLMKRTVDVLVREGDELLEVGFGMGIFATYAQRKNIKTHTIVEGHPQVYEKLKIWAEDKPNVKIIFGDWSKVIESITSMKYDSVYFDTHCDQNIYKFFHFIKNSIKKNGRFSRFNLDLNNKELCKIEFGESEVKTLVNEQHEVNPSEIVKYVKNGFLPICVISL